MTRDQLEFSISQYLDGTLPAGERAELEVRLAADAEARELLAEYRELDALVMSAPMPVPSIRWDAFAAHLSAVIADAAGKAAAAPVLATPRTLRMPWVRSVGAWAVAACVLLASGIGVRTYVHRSGPVGGQGTGPVATVNKPMIDITPGGVTPGAPSRSEIAVGIGPGEDAAGAGSAAAVAVDIGPGEAAGDRNDADVAIAPSHGAVMAAGAGTRGASTVQSPY